jgi:hypothetical protein
MQPSNPAVVTVTIWRSVSLYIFLIIYKLILTSTVMAELRRQSKEL